MEDPVNHAVQVQEATSDGDLQTIRDVLSVHHVPVVASLHWDKLHSILHSLCDRIATQALRLEKAEEQGKTFLGLKDELCQNAVKEMKEAKESETEQQQHWSQMVEERLQILQQGVDANRSGIKRLDDLDTTVQSFAPRLDALEEASKNLDRLDALEEASRNLEAIQASQPISLASLNQKLEELLVDFEEQNEKLHTLEEQNEQLKLRLDQTAKSHASDLEALQQYCRVFVPEAKATATVEELSPKLVDELTKDVKVAIEKHNKELAKVQKYFGMLGKSILILSGHHSEQFKVAQTIDPAEKLVKVLEGLGDAVPIVLPDTLNNQRNSKLVSGTISDTFDSWDLRLGDRLDNEISKRMSKVGLLPTASQRHTLVGTVDQMDDNAVVEAIDDRRSSNGGNGFHMQSTAQPNKSWSGSFSNAGSGVSKSQRGVPSRKASPRKPAM